MIDKIIIATAKNQAPWLANESDSNSIVVSTRLSYTRSICGNKEDGNLNGKKRVIAGISKCKSWDASTLFETCRQPTLTALIAEKFLEKDDELTSRQKGLSAIFKDNMNELCIINDKLKIQSWISGCATAEDLKAFKDEVDSLEKAIAVEENTEHPAQGVYGTEMILHLPAMTICSYNKYFKSLKDFNYSLKGVFKQRKGCFYSLQVVKSSGNAGDDLLQLRDAAEMVKKAEEDARTLVHKSGINCFFKTIMEMMEELDAKDSTIDQDYCLRLLSVLWLARDFGMLPQSAFGKIKRAISNTSDATLEAILHGKGGRYYKMTRVSEIKKVFE